MSQSIDSARRAALRAAMEALPTVEGPPGGVGRLPMRFHDPAASAYLRDCAEEQEIVVTDLDEVDASPATGLLPRHAHRGELRAAGPGRPVGPGTALARSGDRVGAAKLHAERTGTNFVEAQRVVNAL